jgi:hypothetical protein
VERWFGALTALAEQILAWVENRHSLPEPTPYQIGLFQRACRLAEAAAIAAIRPDLVLQERALEYFREEFETLKGERA